jgi:RNA polymerase sigma-70 factor (ECF subfamily)
MTSSASSGTSGTPTSRSLLARLKQHDDHAWSELIELYAPLVYFWCRRSGLAEQDVPDVIQDVFRSVVAGIELFRKDRPADTFRGWLRTVTRNCLADHFRRRNRNPAAVGGTDAHLRIERLPDHAAEIDDEERSAEQALFHRALETIRQHFDPKTWQAFWRVVVDGLSAGEVGAELSMRPGTVRVAKSRVLQRLRRHLGDVE